MIFRRCGAARGSLYFLPGPPLQLQCAAANFYNHFRTSGTGIAISIAISIAIEGQHHVFSHYIKKILAAYVYDVA